jgi:hypothetical protein
MNLTFFYPMISLASVLPLSFQQSLLATYVISRNKTGLLIGVLVRQLARAFAQHWLMLRGVVAAMVQRASQQSLYSSVQIDDDQLL